MLWMVNEFKLVTGNTWWDIWLASALYFRLIWRTAPQYCQMIILRTLSVCWTVMCPHHNRRGVDHVDPVSTSMGVPFDCNSLVRKLSSWVNIEVLGRLLWWNIRACICKSWMLTLSQNGFIVYIDDARAPFLHFFLKLIWTCGFM